MNCSSKSVVYHSLEQIAREGARRALQKAIEDEVAEYVNDHRDHVDDAGHRLVVRNGHKPTRTILSGLGPIEVKQPRVDDRRVDENGVRFRFTSKILPPYLRKTQAIEDLIPWLYLKGISTGEMPCASNPIESTFATVRLRTYRTKGPGSRDAGLAMAFKLARKAESRWRKLNGSAKLQDLIDSIVFVDGERIAA